MLSQHEIRDIAQNAAMGLSPLERAALGVTIIQQITEPNQFTLVNYAGRIVGEHGSLLCRASMDGTSIPEHPTTVTTHENQSRELEPPRQSRARAVLVWMKAVSDRIQNSIWGDLIGVAGIGLIMVAGRRCFRERLGDDARRRRAGTRSGRSMRRQPHEGRVHQLIQACATRTKPT